MIADTILKGLSFMFSNGGIFKRSAQNLCVEHTIKVF